MPAIFRLFFTAQWCTLECVLKKASNVRVRRPHRAPNAPASGQKRAANDSSEYRQFATYD